MHPEIRALQAQYSDLQMQLRTVAQEWHQLYLTERPRLLRLYDLHFGEKERSHQKLTLECAELFRRVELLSIKVTRGEVLTEEMIEYVNRVVDREYQRLRQRMHEAFDMSATERELAARSTVNATSESELVAMYRTLVKKLHPDAVGAAPGADSNWQKLQDAYANRNANELRSLLYALTAEVAELAPAEHWGMERLRQETALLASRLHVESRKLLRLRSAEPLSIANELDNPVWREQHTLELTSREAQKRKELASCKMRYIELTNGGIPPGNTQGATQEEAARERTFVDTTYFGHR